MLLIIVSFFQITAGRNLLIFSDFTHRVDEVQTDFRDEDHALVGIQFLAAPDAFEDALAAPAARKADFSLEAPATADPPGIAVEEAHAVHVALDAMFFQLFVEGNLQAAGIVVHIHKVCTEEVAGTDEGGIVAELRHDDHVAPLGRIVLVLVPEEDAVPILETEASADAHIVAQGDFDAEVGGADGVVGQVVAEGETVHWVLPEDHRRFTLDGDRHNLIAHGAFENNFTVLCTQSSPSQPNQEDHHHPFKP